MLRAFDAVPRERFLPRPLRARALDNEALPIGCDQTISQPQVVARMIELLALRHDDRVLDIGTGSGYHAALLAQLASEVVTIERHRELSESAAATLAELGIENVEFLVGDGRLGAPELAPFDAINVAAAVPGRIPTTLLEQLAPSGALVAPVVVDPAVPEEQRLVLVRRTARGMVARELDPVSFVPLLPGLPD